MKCFQALTLFLFVTSAASVAETDGDPETIAYKYTIASDVLEEERTFWVSLPVAYDDALYAPAKYPVVYVLDGKNYYSLATGIVRWMSLTGNMPEAIVVAIDTSINRTRDLTPSHSLLNPQGKVHFWPKATEPAFASSGRADMFLRFLEAELIPFIEATYRTAPYRTLVGHSFGGLAVAHSFLTQPKLFQGYVSIDGSLWYDNLSMVTEAEKLVNRTDLKGRYYFSLADHETTGPGDLTNMVVGNMRFVDILNKAPSPHLKIKLETFDDESHGSVALPSLYYGLRHVFEGHRFPHGWVKNKEMLVSHFETLSERFGFSYLPPEKLVDNVAYAEFFMPRDDQKETLAFLELNLENYPNSSHAHSSLGDYYRKLNDTDRARNLYQKALELNVENAEARDMLDTLAN